MKHGKKKKKNNRKHTSKVLRRGIESVVLTIRLIVARWFLISLLLLLLRFSTPAIVVGKPLPATSFPVIKFRKEMKPVHVYNTKRKKKETVKYIVEKGFGYMHVQNCWGDENKNIIYIYIFLVVVVLLLFRYSRMYHSFSFKVLLLSSAS